MAHASGERLRVAYLVNRYPSLSHGFIRREIAALEACGVEVERVSIRREPEALLPDEADLAERARTRVLLDRGAAGLLADALVLLARRPRVRLWRAFEARAPGVYWSRIWAIYALLRWCRHHAVRL
jgi:hypothetical protein